MTEENTIHIHESELANLAGIGHNSNEAKDVAGVAGVRLKSFIERIERLEEEKKAITEDIKDIYAECKGTGFDAKTVRKIIGLRKIDVEKRREADELMDIYKSAIGME